MVADCYDGSTSSLSAISDSRAIGRGPVFSELTRGGAGFVIRRVAPGVILARLVGPGGRLPPRALASHRAGILMPDDLEVVAVEA